MGTSLLVALHLLAVIVWVGGMAFAHFCLRPALAVLDPPQRIALMHAVLSRFFPIVAVAALLVLASGVALLALAGFGMNPQRWLMLLLGLVMLAIFGWIRGGLYPRFAASAGRAATAEAAAALAPIRRWVGVNLVLGTLIVLGSALL